MERRTFIIAAVAGGVGLLEYTYFSGWMNHLKNTRPRLRVRDYLSLGERAALAAITPTEDFYNVQKGVPVKVEDRSGTRNSCYDCECNPIVWTTRFEESFPEGRATARIIALLV